MRITTARVLVLLLALLGAGLASLWVDTQGHWRHLVWMAPAAKAPDLRLPVSLDVLASDATTTFYASILERPLFAPDRRPPPPPAPPPPPDPMADIQIYGVVSGGSPSILARVEGKMRRIKLDEALGQWTLKAIDGRNITFAKGDEQRQLKLAYTALGAKATAPATSAASPAGAPTAGRLAAGRNDSAAQNAQDQARENIRRRNEIRAAKGLPLLTQ